MHSPFVPENHPRVRPNARLALAYLTIVSLGLGLAAAPAAVAQTTPVFMDDSAGAADALTRARDLHQIGNTLEAAKVLQRLLDTEGDRVIAVERDQDLFVTVRARVHAALLAEPALLERYREAEMTAAQRALEEEGPSAVERSRFLTPAGFEATLRLAHREIEHARFASAWLMVRQLGTHPDLKGPEAEKAAAALDRLLPYLGVAGSTDGLASVREEVVRARADWRSRAGLPEAPPAAPGQGPGVRAGRAPWEPGERVDLMGILPKPLWTDDLSADGLPDLTQIVQESGRSGVVPPTARLLYAMPVVSGDTLYVNNGRTISAWDRFTLSLKWRQVIESVAGAEQFLTSNARRIIDTCSVAVREPWAVGVSVVPVRGDAIRERVIAALDTRSGAIRWTTTLRELGDPSLVEGGLVLGPVVIDQDVVVVSITKEIPGRRVTSAHLAGLDLATGARRWTVTLASTGSQSWNADVDIADTPVVRDGVIYLADRVGVAGAIESATGRVVWMRRIAPTIGAGRRTPHAWQSRAPVLIGDAVYLQSSDRLSIVELDRASGAVRSQARADVLDEPAYLVGAGEWLVAVADTGISGIRAAEFASARLSARTLFSAASPGIRGRVTVAGDVLVVPVDKGVRLVRLPAPGEPAPDRPSEPPAIELESPGNALALEGQLVVVDDSSAHTYLMWDVAERLLAQRMERDSADPGPAVTYAELSYRAQRTELVLSAADKALGAIEIDPLSAESEGHRRRLFRVLLEMVEPTTRATRAIEVAPALERQLLDRLARCAVAPEERAAHLLALGRACEQSADPVGAVEAYQSVLTSPVLATAGFDWLGTSVPAEDEATRRLRAVVRDHGRTVYAAYEDEAQRQLDAAAGRTDPRAFELIARKYPMARAAARAWFLAADRYRDQGRDAFVAVALEEGLLAAESSLAEDDPLLAQLAGRLVMQLAASGRTGSALETLSRLRDIYPSMPLEHNGAAVEPDEMASRLRERIDRATRRAELGGTVAGRTDLEGWTLINPVLGTPSPTGYAVMRSESREVGVFVPDAQGGVAGLRRAWSGAAREAVVRTGAIGEDATGTPRQGVLTALENRDTRPRDSAFTMRDALTGETLWTIPSVRAALAGDQGDPARALGPDGLPRSFVTPWGESRDYTELIVLADERTLVLVERTGRAATFDLLTGKPLWRTDSSVQRVISAGFSSGTLVVAGADVITAGADAAEPDAEGEAVRWMLVSFDARTGAELSRLEETSPLRWVLMSPEDHAIVGTDAGVLCADVFRGRVRWRDEDSESLRFTDAAWVLPGRVIVKELEQPLYWQLNTADGGIRDEPLHTDLRDIDPRLRGSFVALGARTAALSQQGVMMFDADGALQSANAGAGFTSYLAPALGSRTAVLVSASGEVLPGGSQSFELTLWDAQTGKAASTQRIELGAAPDVVHVIDDTILISAGSSTAVLHAPREPMAPAR